MKTYVEQFAALPAPVQRHLVRITRRVAGMSDDEKVSAQFFFAVVAHGVEEDEDLALAADVLDVCADIVSALAVAAQSDVHAIAPGKD